MSDRLLKFGAALSCTYICTFKIKPGRFINPSSRLDFIALLIYFSIVLNWKNPAVDGLIAEAL